MKKLGFLGLLLAISTLYAAHKKPGIEAEKKALVQAEADFEAARAQKGLEGWLPKIRPISRLEAPLPSAKPPCANV